MNPKQENHSFSVSVATGLAAIGSAAIEKAIILKEFYNLCSWRVDQNKTFFGLGWWYASAENLHKKFPYMNSKNIQRWLKDLEMQGFVYSKVMNKMAYDRTKSYTVNYEAYDSIAQNKYSIAQNEQWKAHIDQLISHNDQPIHSTNNTSINSSNELNSKNEFLQKTSSAPISETSLISKEEIEKEKNSAKKEKEELTAEEQALLASAAEDNEKPTAAEIMRTPKPEGINEGVFHALRVFAAARQQKAKSKRMTNKAWQMMVHDCQKASAEFSPAELIELIEMAQAREYQSPFFRGYKEALIKNQKNNNHATAYNNQQQYSDNNASTGAKLAAAFAALQSKPFA